MSSFWDLHSRGIKAARRRIAPYIIRTPCLEIDQAATMKLENFQIIGAFKTRGAFNALLRIVEGGNPPGVVTMSSGNHAQAIAFAARALGVHAVVLVNEDANTTKVNCVRALGAEVIQSGVSIWTRERMIEKVVEERGYIFVHPYDHWDVIHGQATVVSEILEDNPDVGVIIVPVSGGGLISGVALAAREWDPRIRIIGVEPDSASDARESLQSGVLQRLVHSSMTMADGARALSIGARNFEVMVKRKLVHEIVTVTEDEIGDAVGAAFRNLGLRLEPTGALAYAAYRAHSYISDEANGKLALIASGGNVEPEVLFRSLGL